MSEEEKDAKSPELVGDSEQKAKEEQKNKKGFTRRSLILGTGLGVVVGAVAGVAGHQAHDDSVAQDTEIDGPNYNMIDLSLECPFYDQEHPVGIVDPANQRYCAFAKFNMDDGTSANDLQLLLARWTAAAALLQQGKPLGAIRPERHADSVALDSGDVSELYPANLSITFGFGADLFDDRFGISAFKPKGLYNQPRITGDEYDSSKTTSDFGIQVKGDDPSVVYHAVRHLARIARPYATIFFTQTGYMPFRQTDQHTPRDQFGFRDGTTNPTEEEEFDKYVWISDSEQDWLNGGTYMVYRDDGVDIEAWDNDRISDQEQSVGRRKDTAAPLSSPDGDEFDVPDFNAKDEDGNYMIDPGSHVAITSDIRLGFKILRGSYNYWAGLKDNGLQNAGFLNMAFVNNLDNFMKLRDDMGKYDILNEYYYAQNGAFYAVPQSPKTGRYIGQEFFE